MDSTRRAEDIVSDLFVALKTCQQEYGRGSRNVASESDVRVRQLLDALLSLFSHGLSPTLCRSQFPCAWLIITSLISSDEVVRFNQYDTDEQRLAAWLRHTMNDRMFDKYLRLMLSNRPLLQKYYEPWSAICLLCADPSALLQLTSGCLASVLFAFNTSDSSSNPVSVPSRPSTDNLASVQSAVSASSYNDVLSAWAAGSSQDPSIDDNDRIVDESNESSQSVGMQPFGHSFDGSGIVPVAPSSVANSEPLPSTFGSPGPEIRQSSSRQSLYSSPSQHGGMLGDNSDSNSASESIGRLSTGSGGNGDRVVASGLKANSQQLLMSDSPAKMPNVDRGDTRSTVSLPFVSSSSSAKTLLKPSSREANDDYSHTELKQLLLSVVQEKQTLDKSNRDLESKVAEYRDRLVELEGSVDNLRRRETDLIAAHQLRISAAAKENDILKQQLKKYIAQLQSQNQGGAAGGHTLNGEDGVGSSATERKVLELSEMHGELLEFVELLQAKLRGKEAKIGRLRRQLTALRGPLPPESDDDETAARGEQPSSSSSSSSSLHPTRSSSAGAGGKNSSKSSEKTAPKRQSTSPMPTQPTGSTASAQLIHVWVPLVFLKAAGSPHHIYQIYLRLRDDEWNVFRRYSELYAFHLALKRRYPGAIGKVPFPPKKSMGNRKPEFVENRRQALQTYLRTTFDTLTRSQPEFSRLTRAKLLLLLPFLDERHQPGSGSPGLGVIGPSLSSAGNSSTNLNSSAARDSRGQYAGL